MYSLMFQSGYFASMFTRQWKESEDKVIRIEIPDENVTTDGKLRVVVHATCLF